MPTTNQLTDRVVAVTLLKGGVGKTTIAANLAHELARLGLRVLVADGDPTAFISTILTGADYATGTTLSDILGSDDIDVREAVRPAWAPWQPNPKIPWGEGGALAGRPAGHLDVLHADPDLAKQASSMGSRALQRMRHALFRSGSSPLAADYDVVLIDCQPSPDLSSEMAVMASGSLLLITQPEAGSARGMELAVAFAQQLAKDYDHEVKIGGIVINMFDGRLGEHRRVQDEITDWASANLAQDDMGVVGHVWGNPIPRRSAITGATAERRPVASSLAAGRELPRLERMSMMRAHAALVPIFTLLAMGAVYMVNPQLMPELIARLQEEKMPEAMRAVLFPVDPEALPEELEFPPGDRSPSGGGPDSDDRVDATDRVSIRASA